MVILNTCAVTAAAASDSRQKARQAYRSGGAKIILTGCLATLEPALGEVLPGVSIVISNREKMNIPSLVLHETKDFDLEPMARKPLPGARKRTRAFIKAQDGCNNYCTYCVTRIARGSAASVPKEKVLREIEAAIAGGTQEVVLTGVHLGSWGIDLENGETLTDLIAFLLEHSSIERLRLSSTEPWDLDEQFFALWHDPRMCRHLHLPLQSGAAGVLRRMARHTTPGEYRELLSTAREMIPGVAITTDIIVGFPGETDQEFEESLSFVEEMDFAGGHVFKYSVRQGTAAARLTGEVHGKIAQARSRLMREVLKKSATRYTTRHVGQELSVLWETAFQQEGGRWKLHGLTDNYLQVNALADSGRCNKIDRVKIVSLNHGELAGIIIF